MFNGHCNQIPRSAGSFLFLIHSRRDRPRRNKLPDGPAERPLLHLRDLQILDADRAFEPHSKNHFIIPIPKDFVFNEVSQLDKVGTEQGIVPRSPSEPCGRISRTRLSKSDLADSPLAGVRREPVMR